MGIQIIGSSGVSADVDGSKFRALRITQRPLDYGILGHYRFSQTVALVATQAANGTLFSFRWTDATRLCVPLFLRLECQQTAAATGTIFPRFQIFIARSFTVADSAGTALTFSGNNGKKRTDMGSTLVSDMRFSTAAAGLTAGTRTLDAQPILEMTTQQTITTTDQIAYRKELNFTNAGDMPIVLAQNEGWIVRGPTTVFGAAGTADLVVEFAYAELTSY